MKIKRISAAALAAVMMTGTAITAFAEDEINADFKAKVDALAAKVDELEKQSEEIKANLTAKYGDDLSTLTKEQQEAFIKDFNEGFGAIIGAVTALTPQLQKIIDMKDTLNEAEKKYAEDNLSPNIFDTTLDSIPGLDMDLPTDPGTSDTDTDTNTDTDNQGTSGDNSGTTTSPTTPDTSDTNTGSSDNSDTGVGGIAVLAGTVALAGAVAIISRKKK